MVITCSSCGRKQAKACGFTFFSYPKNDILRSEWLKSCRLDLHPENNTSNMKLCSAHFEESNFRNTKSVPLILKPNAIPTLFGKNISQSVKSVSKIKMQRAVPSNQPVKRKLSFVKDEQITILGASLEINPTANKRETVENYTTTMTPMKKREIWGPRHGMDMSPSHFSTPTKAERNLLIVKRDIQNRDMGIKQLIQKKYRMNHVFVLAEQTTETVVHQEGAQEEKKNKQPAVKTVDEIKEFKKNKNKKRRMARRAKQKETVPPVAKLIKKEQKTIQFDEYTVRKMVEYIIQAKNIPKLGVNLVSESRCECLEHIIEHLKSTSGHNKEHS